MFGPCFVMQYLVSVLSSFAFISLRNRDLEMVALLLHLLPSLCLVAVSVLWLFLKLPWVGLQCVIVAFPDHTDTYFFC